MKRRYIAFVFSSLMLICLIGCNVTVQPKNVKTLSPSTSVSPTSLPPAKPTPVAEKGFTLYLTSENISPDQLATLSHLELENTPFLSINDIVAYTKGTHEIELTASGYERLHSLHVPTSGRAFAICVDGEPIYAGAFWADYSSQSFDGVVIDQTIATREHPVITIQLGYPNADFYHGDDPRSDVRIFNALEQAGKLK